MIHTGSDAFRDKIESELVAVLAAHGNVQTRLSDDLRFILNFTRFDLPGSVQRKAQNEFVVSVAVLTHDVDDLRYLCYNTLIQTLSNFVVCIKTNGEDVPDVYCITPEVGFYHFKYNPQKVYDAMTPIISAHFAIGNRIRYDLPEMYTESPAAGKLKHYGAELERLGVLPAPFRLKEVLSAENIEHLYDLFEIKGLSYGNLSIREPIKEVGPLTFWMTARGCNKARLKGVGQDILLVEGCDEPSGDILVRVPAGSDRRMRVSVDAIEHVLIYQTFPRVGAIVHVHAWMNDVICTRQNYPCGTIELAREVVGLLQSTPDPDKAVIGLKNHGLTITGPGLEDIFARIHGKLLKEVPMID